MRLEDSLVLNIYFHNLFGVSSFDDLKSLLRACEEGTASDGHSHFYNRLSGQQNLRIDEDKLREYDHRIMKYEAELASYRTNFRLKYFQYLGLLYTEIFLDKLTAYPEALRVDLNLFAQKLRLEQPSLQSFPDFESDDLRRLAFFMATGSGKTLVLHINIKQVLFYLKNGDHPEALVGRPDKLREFDNILLITPNEGLSAQHLKEFRESGMDATLFIDDPSGRSLFGPRIKVIEIHKLAETASRDGVSIPLEQLGSHNFILVDEGHKGTGSDARVWKDRQQRLSADGFMMEYSATFAQAIAAVQKSKRPDLLEEYGKSIIFDYSYGYFYGDGYGKNFKVLNLSNARDEQAYELMLGGLLVFYQQQLLFEQKVREYRPYNIEKPLWVLLGTSVSKKKGSEKDTTKTAEQERSDVANVLAFLRLFAEDSHWAITTIGRMIRGESEFMDTITQQDLFIEHLEHLKHSDAKTIYKHIRDIIFHGPGGLEVWELKNADGELALRMSSAEDKQTPYFGVINIGDVSSFKKHLEHFHIDVKEDRFTKSQFVEVDKADSRINLLIGAKKFIEGWSSWRVSSMGLMNVGKGEGSQIIQLFGRGVRLKGKRMTLKRSTAIPEEGPHPSGLNTLETLYIFGWNADYIKTFREMLDKEGVMEEFTLHPKIKDPWPQLPIPSHRRGYDMTKETWTLIAEKPFVKIDMMPKVSAFIADGYAHEPMEGWAGREQKVNFTLPEVSGLINEPALYSSLIEFKQTRGIENVFVPRSTIKPILENSELTVSSKDAQSPDIINDGASRILKSYLTKFVGRKEREAETNNSAVETLEHTNRIQPYTIRVKQGQFLQDIRKLIENPKLLEFEERIDPLPRLHVGIHLFNPILLEGGKEWKKEVFITPPPLTKDEWKFVDDVRTFWKDHSHEDIYFACEIFLLRNLPRVGIGLFNRSGFYPDFILWFKNNKNGSIHLRFVEPHGLHHDGLSGIEDKVAALRKLQVLSETKIFKKEKIIMDGYILTTTNLVKIPDVGDRGWTELKNDFCVLNQSDEYITTVMNIG